MTEAVLHSDDLSSDSRRRIAEFASVLEVTKSLAAEADLERLLQLIIQQACGALRCERASLFLHDENRRQLYTRAVTQLEGIREIRVSLDEGIVGLAARELRMVHVPDPYSHPLFNAEVDKRTHFHTRNILCAPLVSWGPQGKLLGVLQLLNRDAATFDAADHALLDAFAAHAAIAIDRAILAQHYEEKLRLLVSLDVARKVQAGLFPKQLPTIAGYELAGTSRPADATGGDYYDALPLADGSLGLVVADVCGHGLGPSLLMAAVRATLRGLALRDAEPGKLLTDLGASLYADLSATRRFVTLLFGALDPREHCFRFANAGHGPIVLHYKAATDEFVSLVDDEARGCPLGIMEETYGTAQPLDIQPGDMLVLGTDGLVETRRERELFGMERLMALIREHRREPLTKIIERAFDATTAFDMHAKPEDDLTLMLVRRL